MVENSIIPGGSNFVSHNRMKGFSRREDNMKSVVSVYIRVFTRER